MKKILSILTILLLSMNAVLADDIPQWSEFTPAGVNANDAYWAQRKAKFEQSLNQCKPYKGKDLKACYTQIREAEKTKTQSWKFRNQH